MRPIVVARNGSDHGQTTALLHPIVLANPTLDMVTCGLCRSNEFLIDAHLKWIEVFSIMQRPRQLFAQLQL